MLFDELKITIILSSIYCGHFMPWSLYAMEYTLQHKVVKVVALETLNKELLDAQKTKDLKTRDLLSFYET